MKPSKIRVFVPETPIYVEACAVEASYVGLGQPPDCRDYRVFLLLGTPGVLHPGMSEPVSQPLAMFHISLDDARFLREALDAVLERHRVIAESAN